MAMTPRLRISVLIVRLTPAVLAPPGCGEFAVERPVGPGHKNDAGAATRYRPGLAGIRGGGLSAHIFCPTCFMIARKRGSPHNNANVGSQPRALVAT